MNLMRIENNQPEGALLFVLDARFWHWLDSTLARACAPEESMDRQQGSTVHGGRQTNLACSRGRKHPRRS
jgi:hypothetical protein